MVGAGEDGLSPCAGGGGGGVVGHSPCEAVGGRSGAAGRNPHACTWGPLSPFPSPHHPPRPRTVLPIPTPSSLSPHRPLCSHTILPTVCGRLWILLLPWPWVERGSWSSSLENRITAKCGRFLQVTCEPLPPVPEPGLLGRNFKLLPGSAPATARAK